MHRKCQQRMPVLCGGDCKFNAAVQLHTHDGKMEFIPYEQVTQKIQVVSQKENYQQHFETVKKRVSIIKDSLDSMVRMYQKDLGELELTTTTETQRLICQIQSHSTLRQIRG